MVAVNVVVDDGYDDLLGLLLLPVAFVVLDDPADVVPAVGYDDLLGLEPVL